MTEEKIVLDALRQMVNRSLVAEIQKLHEVLEKKDDQIIGLEQDKRDMREIVRGLIKRLEDHELAKAA